MKKATVGAVKYIVLGWSAPRAMGLSPEGHLFNSNVGSLFDTRAAARNAIRRTKRLAAREGLQWDLHKCQIQAVRATQ